MAGSDLFIRTYDLNHKYLWFKEVFQILWCLFHNNGQGQSLNV